MEIGKDLGGKFMNKEKLVAGTSRWDRYLGMTAAMTQVSVPSTASARPWTREERQKLEEDIDNSNKFLGL